MRACNGRHDCFMGKSAKLKRSGKLGVHIGRLLLGIYGGILMAPIRWWFKEICYEGYRECEGMAARAAG